MNETQNDAPKSSFELLLTKRFGPIFSVQYMNAFNDNVFKNALIVLFAFRASSEAEAGLLTNLAAGALILPFFILSQLAGQLADKYEKSMLVRRIKFCEIIIMSLAALGFYLGSNTILFISLFLMGAQSTFFSPIKYSIVPQVMKPTELVGANALLESGTFLAILTGTIVGGLVSSSGPTAIGTAIIGFAILGWIISLKVPPVKVTTQDLKIEFNPIKETLKLAKLALSNHTIFLCILGCSWFWFFGAVVLSQIAVFTKVFLYGNEFIVTLLLAVFSISIGLGSFMCEFLSRKEVEIGLVPIGAAGMSIFCLDLFFVPYTSHQPSIGIAEFLAFENSHVSYRVLLDTFGMGFFAAFFIVPLYALIQDRADDESCSRIIAFNNIVNAGFMIFASALTILAYSFGLSTVAIFFTLGVLNIVVSIAIFLLVPEFLMRFIIWILASFVYSLKYEGRQNLPRKGAAVIVCNHVSYIDWFIITAACRRPVRFVMHVKFYNLPVVHWICRLAKAIPIAGSKESEETKNYAFAKIAAELEDEQIICIFPEGNLTNDGELAEFRTGVERILQDTPVAVYAMSLSGLWGSFFSRSGGQAIKKIPKPTHRKIQVKISESLEPTVNAEQLRKRIQGMLVDE